MLTTAADLAKITQFLYHEAQLIDDRQFDQWLELFTDDCRYWVPCNNHDADPTVSVSLIYDDKTHLTERVFRATGRVGFAQSPPSASMHMVTNVMACPKNDETDDETGIRVRPTQLVAAIRRGSEHLYAAHAEHRLVTAGESFRIARKKMALLRVPLEKSSSQVRQAAEVPSEIITE